MQELTLDPTDLAARNYSSLAALVFLMLEYLVNCRSEYNYIWRARPTVVKYIYLVSRYTGLIGQIVHYCLVHLFLNNGPVEPQKCRIWFLFLFGACSIAVATLDAILLLRVYALYRKDTKVHILALPLVLQFVVGSVVMERAHGSRFNYRCDKVSSPFETSLLGGTVIAAHTALWVATFAKRNVAGGHAAVVQLVVREGAWTNVVLVVVVAILMAYAIVYVANPFAIFIWPTALISVITCRIILNMNMLKTELPEDQGELASTEEFHLSTMTIISRV